MTANKKQNIMKVLDIPSGMQVSNRNHGNFHAGFLYVNLCCVDLLQDSLYAGMLLFQPHGSDYRIFHSKHSMLFSSALGKSAVLKSLARYIPGWSAISQQRIIFHITAGLYPANKQARRYFILFFFFFSFLSLFSPF